MIYGDERSRVKSFGHRHRRGRMIREQGPAPARAKAARKSSRKTPKSSARRPRGTEKERERLPEPGQKRVDHPPFVAGVGASAGGLEAFTQLLKALPSNTGIAFVLVQHLAPKHESFLSELLSRATTMPVKQASEGDLVLPDHVYVIPPNVEMVIRRRHLHLMPRGEAPGPHLSIDTFLRSLADDQESEAIGILLSGSSSDGALGMAAIKSAGGITIAQEEHSAKYGSMPHSAIATGAADFVLTPEQIARELVRIAGLPRIGDGDPERPFDGTPVEVDGHLTRIFRQVQNATGIDFSLYKQNTIKRRIKRRMVLHRIARLEDYLAYLRGHAEEARTLHEDLLVNVTGFFRDPESYEALTTLVFPAICRDGSGPVRIWVPGCSTGEEAYSIAISLFEFLGDRSGSVPLQLFATDLSERAIEIARVGVYRENIAADVSPERLRRFFVKIEGGYQVSKAVRDACVFARQDIARDPPFSKLDLISCRNVLIYLGPVLQRQVLPVFHYALKPNRFLVLGKAESIIGFSDLFEPVERRNRVFRRKTTSARVSFEFPPGARRDPKEAPAPTPGDLRRVSNMQREADRLLLARYAPVGVLINEAMEILQVRGHTGDFLEAAPGHASVNLLRMAREGLPPVLRGAVREAIKTRRKVRRDRVPYRMAGQRRLANLEVTPVADPDRSGGDNFYLVMFEPTDAERGKASHAEKRPPAGSKARGEAGRLRRELLTTKEYLEAMIQELEATNEELKSANEEILSSNEELQSTNEELETAKEELQSSSEELTTINDELQNRNADLSVLNNDLTNVLTSVSLPIVIIGSDLRIRRFTPAAEKPLNLIPGDVGRRVTDIKPNVPIVGLEAMLLEVMETVSSRESSVRDEQGRWYSLRVRPYRTLDNRIDGALLMLVDVTDLRTSLQSLAETRNYAQAIVETIQEGFLVLDDRFRVRSANDMFFKHFGLAPDQVLDQPLETLGNGAWNDARLMEALQSVGAHQEAVSNLDLEIDLPSIGRRSLLLSVRRLEGESLPGSILCSIDDVTDRQRAEQAMRDLSAHLLQVRDEEQRRIARELHDSTAQSLAAIALNLELASSTGDGLNEEQQKLLVDSRTLAEQCSRELRDISELLHPPMLEEVGLVGAVRWLVDTFSRRTGIQVTLSKPEDLGRLPEPVETALFRVIQESLTNVARHSGSRTAEVSIATDDGGITVRIADRGRGFPVGSVSSGVSLASLGVGVAGMRARVKQLNGLLTIQSGSWGTRVQAHVPLSREES
jgi:two-component system CheB/CheR fusion protein